MSERQKLTDRVVFVIYDSAVKREGRSHRVATYADEGEAQAMLRSMLPEHPGRYISCRSMQHGDLALLRDAE